MLYATYQLNDAAPVRISLTIQNAFASQCPVKFIIRYKYLLTPRITNSAIIKSAMPP